jgi:hypothetical protein
MRQADANAQILHSGIAASDLARCESGMNLALCDCMKTTTSGADDKSIEAARPQFSAVAAFPLALLVTIASVGGILVPSTYARETVNWKAQAIGQDWVDLLLAVPWLVLTGIGAWRGSCRASLLLAGGFAYTAYEFVIYAFAVHFNVLFLVYCAALGLSIVALIGTLGTVMKHDPSSGYGGRVPIRLGGGFLIAVGIVFGLLWLSEIVPALARGVVPSSIAEAGLFTNPVHVIDLSVVLPAHIICGIWLIRRRRLAYAIAPIILGFGVLMALSIAGMMVVMRIRHAEVNLVVAGAMTVVAIASAAVLVTFLRRLR